jgi:hypothetical protein
MPRKILVLKGLFGKKDYSKLQKKQVTGKDGKKHTVYVDPNKDAKSEKTKKEKEAEERKKWKEDQKKHDSRRPNLEAEEKKKIEEAKARHIAFEELAKDQRRNGYGTRPPTDPKPGVVMRVYAKGKANVGGMLAKVHKVLDDGKTLMVELSNGHFHQFPIDYLQVAKAEPIPKKKGK